MIAGRPLTLRQLNRATLDRQGLLRRGPGPIDVAIRRLAGLQAQHANQPYIAAWSRVQGFTIDQLEAALEAHSVVRATVMRATLHIVEARDFFAFDRAAAELRTANWSASSKRAGADIATLNAALLAYCAEPRTIAAMEQHLDTVLPDAKLEGVLPAGVRHAAFRLASAGGGLVHVPPSGSWKWHGKQQYIDARVWLPGAERPGPDDALRIAAERYLGAYGPASASDFGKWAGLARVGRIRTTLEALDDQLVRYTGPDGRELVDLIGHDVPDGDVAAPARFLARWDSVLIGYDVRDRMLPDAYRAAVIKKNGDFLPTFLIDGFVAGLWSVVTTKGTAVIRLEPFATVGRGDRAALEEEAGRLVRFVEAEADRHEVAWT